MDLEFSAQRSPYFKKISQPIIKIIKYGQKEEDGDKANDARNPFPPVERPENSQPDPNNQECINKRQVDHVTYGDDHPQVVTNRFGRVALIKVQQLIKHPY